ncbi:MAG: tetratricopeptide repeat protein [Candidatus Shapirobacteria bacterium]
MSQRKIKKLKKESQVVANEESGLLSNTSPYIEIGFWGVVRKYWKFLTILLVLASLLYFNSLAGNFVSDDYASITQFPNIGDFWYMFSKDSYANSMYMTNHFIYSFFGSDSPIPYHFVSFVSYLLVLVVGFVFVLTVFENETLAMVAMLLFTVMPIHVEAVSWISGRLYVLLAIYILASMLNFIYFINRGKYKNLILSFLFFVLAFQTDKPRPFALFFIILIYMFFVGWNRLKKYFSKIWWMLPVVMVVFVYLAIPYTNVRIDVVNSGINGSGGIFYDPFFQYPTAIAKYLQLLWFPIDLTLYHTMYVIPIWLNWSILIVYLTMLVYFYFNDKRYFFALAFIFAAAAPSMAPVKVSWLVAERYMFLGSLGFAIFLALIILDLSKYLKLIPSVLFISLLVFGMVRTFLRNSDWTTNHDLWVSTCIVSPNSHNAWNNIGDDYDKLKDYSNAIKGFTQSTIVKPNYADAYHNRANIFYKVGRLDLARESYQTAIRLNPNLYQTYMSLIQIDLMEKKFDLALANTNRLIDSDRNNPQFKYILGVVYVQSGDLAKGVETFESILKTNPDFEQAKKALAELEKSPTTKK